LPVPALSAARPGLRSFGDSDLAAFGSLPVRDLAPGAGAARQLPQVWRPSVRLPGAEPGGRFTLLLERFAIDVWLSAQVQSRAAQLLRLSAAHVESLLQRAVARGWARRSQTRAVPHVQLDEQSLHRGLESVSSLSDGAPGAVREVVAERTPQATQS